MKYSDFDLVRGIKSGDKSALDPLIHRWYPRIYGYVFKLIGHEQDSYDVTQDIFIAMMQNIKNYYPWKKFDSWLFTIAHNKCMDFFRMQQRVGQPESADIDLPDAAPLLDETVVVSVTIKNALTKLSAPQREVVLLYYFYQYTAKEIAQMTNTPLPTIKSRIGTAKKILARYLREDFQ